MKHFLLTRHLLGSVRTLEKKQQVLACFEVHWQHYTHTHTQSVAATSQIDAGDELSDKHGQTNGTRQTLPAPYMYIGKSAPASIRRTLIYNERRRPDHTAGNHHAFLLLTCLFCFFRRLSHFFSLHTHEVHFIKVVVAQFLCLCFDSFNTLPC